MPEQQKLKIDDNIIREALNLELESVEAPHPSKLWQRIEDRTDKSRQASFYRSGHYSWSRLAAVAAVFLVVVLGGIGLFRSVQFGSAPAADSIIPVSMDEDVTTSHVEDDSTEEEEMAVMQEPEDGVSIESVPPADEDEVEDKGVHWPLLLAEKFRLANTIILSAEGEPLYSGAFYKSGNVELLLVITERTDETTYEFIDTLGKFIGAELNVVDERNDYLYFETFEMPGLAWQKDSRNQALMITSGILDISELEIIAGGIN